MSPSNIFNIKTPQLYRCHVYRYHSTLSRLYVRAFKGAAQDPAFYLLFSDVGYFEGPMNWQGVQFRLAPTNKCLALMQRSAMLEGVSVDMLAALGEIARLYVLDLPQAQVRIVAGQATKLNKVVLEF
jgi:hypothetical protein